jgi:hypothetical protein
MAATQHDNNMVAAQHDNNMEATQHGSSTKHGTNMIGHRGQEGRDNNTSRKAATTVSKSVHESLNEEIARSITLVTAQSLDECS